MIELIAKIILLKKIFQEFKNFQTVWVFDENGLEFRGFLKNDFFKDCLVIRKIPFETYRCTLNEKSNLTLGVIDCANISDVLKNAPNNYNDGTVTIKVQENVNEIEFIFSESVMSSIFPSSKQVSFVWPEQTQIPFHFRYHLEESSKIEERIFKETSNQSKFLTPEANYVCEFSMLSSALKSICDDFNRNNESHLFRDFFFLKISAMWPTNEVQFSEANEVVVKTVTLQHPLYITFPLEPVSSTVSGNQLHSIVERMNSLNQNNERYSTVRVSLSHEGPLRLVFGDNQDWSDREVIRGSDQKKFDDCMTFYLNPSTRRTAPLRFA